jgi:hypothetical protein
MLQKLLIVIVIVLMTSNAFALAKAKGYDILDTASVTTNQIDNAFKSYFVQEANFSTEVAANYTVSNKLDAGATATDSSLLQGQNGAYYLDRSHHSGSQSHTTISDWSAEVAANWTVASKANSVDVYTKTNAQTTGEALFNWANIFNKPSIGTGDMTKAEYATGEAGVVNNANELNGQLAAYYLDRANHTGSQAHTTISDWSAEVAANWTVASKLGATATAADSDKVDGQHGAYYLDRANQTGTQNCGTISNFSTEVKLVITGGISKVVDQLTGDGETLEFNMSQAALWAPDVYLGRAVYQFNGTDYTYSATTKKITFDAAPEAGVKIAVVYYYQP